MQTQRMDCGHSGGERVKRTERSSDIRTLVWEADSRGRLLHVHREPNPVPCDDLGGGMGWVQEGGDICLLVADSHCRMVAANKIL